MKKEFIILCDINNIPNKNSMREIFLEEDRLNYIFRRNSINWLKQYLNCIDKNNFIHIELLFKYIFYFMIQDNDLEFINSIINLICEFK